MFVCKLSLKMILIMKNEKLFGLAFEESNFLTEERNTIFFIYNFKQTQICILFLKIYEK